MGLKSMLLSTLSKDKLISLSPNSRKNTDATTSVSSPLDVTASTERAHQDHAHSHQHQNTHTRWSVSVLSRSTGTVPNTHVSEPALLRKRPAASITKATSMKSEPRLPDTSLHSMPRSVNGKPKSQNGNQLPMPVLKKIACMLPWSYCGTEPTEAEIEAFRQKLRTQAQTWINETEQRLLDQITALATRITNSIDSWK